MEKERIEKVETNLITHEFYCDRCGKFIGDATEYYDGYYTEIGTYELEICIEKKWYKLKKHFCEDCKDKATREICNAVKRVGFVEEQR